MIGMALLALVLALTGCWSPAWPDQETCEAPAQADAAIASAVEEWSYVFGRDLGEPPPFVWFEGPCLTYDGEDIYGYDCTHGSHWLGTDITGEQEIIYLVWTENPAAGSLAHELLHWALRGDPGHTHEFWQLVAPITHDLINQY